MYTFELEQYMLICEEKYYVFADLRKGPQIEIF